MAATTPVITAGATTGPPWNLPFAIVPKLKEPDLVEPLEQILASFKQVEQICQFTGGFSPRNPDLVQKSAGDARSYVANNGHRFYALAGETIALGAAVNLYNNNGVIGVRNALAADNTRLCHGFCSQGSSGIAAGSIGESILFDGVNLNLSGLTPGVVYYLSATVPGGLIAVAPSGGTTVAQAVCFSTSATAAIYNPFFLANQGGSSPPPTSNPQDFTAYSQKTLIANQVVLAIKCQRPLSFAANCFLLNADTAFTSSAAFSILKNGVTTVGTLTIGAGGTISTSSQAAFATVVGDDIRIIAPATPDATGAGVEASGTATR